MILHVNFSDGSNPWVCFSNDRKEIAEHWRDWMKYHPEEARPVAYCGGGKCILDPMSGEYVVICRPMNPKRYKHLGHALNALARRGGENE